MVVYRITNEGASERSAFLLEDDPAAITQWAISATSSATKRTMLINGALSGCFDFRTRMRAFDSGDLLSL